MLCLRWEIGIFGGWHLHRIRISLQHLMKGSQKEGVHLMILLTMTLFLFLGDQGTATIQILLNKGILNLRNTLFQLPICVHSRYNNSVCK